MTVPEIKWARTIFSNNAEKSKAFRAGYGLIPSAPQGYMYHLIFVGDDDLEKAKMSNLSLPCVTMGVEEFWEEARVKDPEALTLSNLDQAVKLRRGDVSKLVRERDRQIVKMHSQGWTQYGLALFLSISQNAVSKIVKKDARGQERICD